VGTADEVVEWGDEEFDHALKQAAEGVVDARGVRLTPQQLDGLLAAAPRDPDNPQHAQFKSADFHGATFSGDARFDGATFSGDARFGRATFSGDTWFDRATFSGDASFRRATFRGHAHFDNATFRGAAGFHEATVSGDARFGGATFSGNARFYGATFSGLAIFYGATFSGGASFYGATFKGLGRFDWVIFGGRTSFEWATFSRDANVSFVKVTFGESVNFGGARLEGATEFGPIHVHDGVRLEGVLFAERVRIAASARRASFARAEFRRGADVQLRWAEVWLEDADFAEPSLLTPLPARFTSKGGKRDALLGWEEPGEDGSWFCRLADKPPQKFAPRVLSVRGARVARLTLSDVHLEACRFADAHGLDGLGLEPVEFAGPPDGWRWVRWWPVRWTRRQAIAEEHHWRACTDHGPGWDQGQLPTGSSPWPPQPPAELEPGRIAGLYRQLRKSREESKDEPGANDFYYGEMEMRRRSGPFAERLILRLYWLLSGYGLRASRALLALAITIAVLGAIPLTLWGFRPTRAYGTVLLFALQSSISLLRAPSSPPAHETAAGQLIEIFLRLAGPLFFGLALLALRGRVKR
jgi:uncharacterized protein YjbI with pentapeptide repeats